jgi:hypothetical protein
VILCHVLGACPSIFVPTCVTLTPIYLITTAKYSRLLVPQVCNYSTCGVFTRMWDSHRLAFGFDAKEIGMNLNH